MKKGLDYKNLPDIYVIFISRFDMFQKYQTIYHLETIIRETGTFADNGIHRIFVDRVYYFNESKEETDAMTQIVEEYANKKVLERDKETAKSFLQNGASVELVKKSIPTLSVEL